jgi:hypothetical protein
MPRTRIVLAALAIALVAIVGLGAVVAYDSIDTSPSQAPLNLGQLRTALKDMPREPLTAGEREGILTLREGSKLSHDVYTAYAATWTRAVFGSNAFNAATHADAMILLLERYGLTDPLAGRPEGQFMTQRFRDLYGNLAGTAASLRPQRWNRPCTSKNWA